MIKLRDLLQRYELAENEISELGNIINEFEEKYTKNIGEVGLSIFPRKIVIT